MPDCFENIGFLGGVCQLENRLQMLTDGKKGGLYHILSVIMVSAQQMAGVGIGLGLVLIVKLLKLQFLFR